MPRTRRARTPVVGGESPARVRKSSKNQVAEKHGGKREGAGRPPKEITEQRRELQAAFIKRGKARFNTIIDKTLDLAEAGDASARADVLKYLCGQPTQPIEFSGDQRLVIEYVNDWRGASAAPLSAPGTEHRALPGPTFQLSGGGATVAEDDAQDGD